MPRARGSAGGGSAPSVLGGRIQWCWQSFAVLAVSFAAPQRSRHAGVHPRRLSERSEREALEAAHCGDFNLQGDHLDACEELAVQATRFSFPHGACAKLTEGCESPEVDSFAPGPPPKLRVFLTMSLSLDHPEYMRRELESAINVTFDWANHSHVNFCIRNDWGIERRARNLYAAHCISSVLCVGPSNSSLSNAATEGMSAAAGEARRLSSAAGNFAMFQWSSAAGNYSRGLGHEAPDESESSPKQGIFQEPDEVKRSAAPEELVMGIPVAETSSGRQQSLTHRHHSSRQALSRHHKLSTHSRGSKLILSDDVFARGMEFKARRPRSDSTSPQALGRGSNGSAMDGFAGQWDKGAISKDCTKFISNSGAEYPVEVADGKITLSIADITYTGTLHGGRIRWNDGDVWQREDQARLQTPEDSESPTRLQTPEVQTPESQERMPLAARATAPDGKEEEEPEANRGVRGERREPRALMPRSSVEVPRRLGSPVLTQAGLSATALGLSATGTTGLAPGLLRGAFPQLWDRHTGQPDGSPVAPSAAAASTRALPRMQSREPSPQFGIPEPPKPKPISAEANEPSLRTQEEESEEDFAL